MLEVNYTNLHDNVKRCMDRVTDEYVMGNKVNHDWLMESKAQLENGHCASYDLVEVDDE